MRSTLLQLPRAVAKVLFVSFSPIHVSLFLFLLIGGTARAQLGTTWTTQTTPSADIAWFGLAYGNGLFVAVSASGTGNRIMTSPDGVTWTLQTTPADNSWVDITFGNGLFVAVAGTGTGNRVMTSPDGVIWTLRTTPVDNNWAAVTYGNGLFVATSVGGIGNRVMTSPDGITWTIRTSAGNYAWNSVTYGNGLFVAVSLGVNVNVDRVMSSPDGINWSIHNAPNNNSWTDVVYGNGLFVAVSQTGTGNRVMTSPDGSTWTAQTTPADNSWRSVTYGGGLFVAVAQTGTSNRVMTSPDAVTWTLRTNAVDNAWQDIIYAAGLFVATANTGTGNQVMTSGSLTLPLHWLSVSGRLSNTNQAQISWRVEETDVTGYKVEKSTDGVSFKTIGSLAGQGNGQHSYTFTESQTLGGKAYYRIKQIDLDGRSTYSSILTLHHTTSGIQTSIYPNPAKGVVTVTIGNDLLHKTAIVTNFYGKTLQTIKLNSLSFTINIEQYPAGIYYMKVDKEKPVKIIKE